jgi:hypothetical protein
MIESPSGGPSGKKMIQIKPPEDAPIRVRGDWLVIEVGRLGMFLYQILYVIFLDK